MSALPGDASPPKSGCSARVVPMNEMYADDCGSTGAVVTSTFHQLSAGKIGSGPGIAPPSVAVAPSRTVAPTIAAAVAATRLRALRFGAHGRTSGVQLGMASPEQVV